MGDSSSGSILAGKFALEGAENGRICGSRYRGIFLGFFRYNWRVIRRRDGNYQLMDKGMDSLTPPQHPAILLKHPNPLRSFNALKLALSSLLVPSLPS